MSPAHVFPPTYEEIKRRLMAGVWPSGFKLEAMQLANDLGVSMSPVRDSLNRLMGERIVEAVPGQGFCVARFDEQGLRDLLDFNLALLLLASGASAFTGATAADLDHPSRTAALFLSVAEGAGNQELSFAVGNLNDRLQALRHLDRQVLGEVATETDALEAALRHSTRRQEVTDMLIRYHVRRKTVVEQYIRLRAGTGHGHD